MTTPPPEPARRQRVAAYAVVVADDAVLLTRISERGAHPGSWTLPGGGVDHGEAPAATVVRETREETGLTVTVERLLTVHDIRFTGTAPSGRLEDYHGIHLVYAGRVAGGDPRVAPRVAEPGGTTDAAAWVPLADLRSGRVPVLPVVHAGLAAFATG